MKNKTHLLFNQTVKFVLIMLSSIFFNACIQDTDSGNSKTNIENNSSLKNYITPEFNADSAYTYIKKQVDFGPRVPNTQAHINCGNWLVGEFERFGLEVSTQEATLLAYNKTPLNAKNIIAKYKPTLRRRVLLCAHWDTRPYADHDPNPDNYHLPIDGANDGGSGVGVILELARLMAKEDLPLGIDFVLFDAEDYGQPADSPLPKVPNSYCLGSQYWAKSIKNQPNNAMYGILLDMVGAKNATFTKEGSSMQFAPHIVKKVWTTAYGLGYGSFFIDINTKGIIDDHVYVSSIASIPTIDIIEYDPKTATNFGHYWHTQKDNMEIIDSKTLKAVGQTVLEVLFKEAYD